MRLHTYGESESDDLVLSDITACVSRLADFYHVGILTQNYTINFLLMIIPIKLQFPSYLIELLRKVLYCFL